MDRNMNIDKNKILSAIINSGDKKINRKDVERAGKGDISGLLGSLDTQDRKKLQEALNDKEKARKILASKEGREILKSFLGGKQNG